MSGALVRYLYLADGTKLAAFESTGFSAGRIVKNGSAIVPTYHVNDYLCSVRVVTDAAGEVLERNDYSGISPYAYCAGDPVNFVDPEGMDIWHINRNGVITWEEKSEDHRLYSLDNYGNRSENYVIVNDRKILDIFADKTGTTSYTTSSNIDDVYKVFLLAANNSEVEWVVHRGQDDMYTIGTLHDEDSAGSWSDYGIDKPVASVHSHPGRYNEYASEMESMGYFDDISLGDRDNVVHDVDVNGRQTRYNYVYFGHTGHLYHVEYYKPRFIKSVDNYRQFYFGTLNHQ